MSRRVRAICIPPSLAVVECPRTPPPQARFSAGEQRRAICMAASVVSVEGPEVARSDAATLHSATETRVLRQGAPFWLRIIYYNEMARQKPRSCYITEYNGTMCARMRDTDRSAR